MKIAKIAHALRAAAEIKTLITSHPEALTPAQRGIFDQYGQLRTDYVLQEGWPIDASGVDIDVYDTAAESHYVIAYAGETAYAGLRLTNVTSLWGSLSYSMWSHAQERTQFDQMLSQKLSYIKHIEGVGKAGHLWDVTRLISAGALGMDSSQGFKARSRIGVISAMAAAVTITDDPMACWIFTVSASALRFMRRNGFAPHVLAHGKISEQDEEHAYFGYVNPHEVLKNVRRSSATTYRFAKRAMAQTQHIKQEVG